MKISKKIPKESKWKNEKTGFRYPKDLDKFKGDPAGEGGEYIDPTHLRLPNEGEKESTCKLCHGTTYEPIKSRLARGDPPLHRCVNCGHEEYS
tara:strand:+ start:203 stop:481 length:279 start_codon:yes stop_codon:yes gene_type:complete